MKFALSASRYPAIGHPQTRIVQRITIVENSSPAF
jgi:hypothetical protein